MRGLGEGCKVPTSLARSITEPMIGCRPLQTWQRTACAFPHPHPSPGESVAPNLACTRARNYLFFVSYGSRSDFEAPGAAENIVTTAAATANPAADAAAAASEIATAAGAVAAIAAAAAAQVHSRPEPRPSITAFWFLPRRPCALGCSPGWRTFHSSSEGGWRKIADRRESIEKRISIN